MLTRVRVEPLEVANFAGIVNFICFPEKPLPSLATVKAGRPPLILKLLISRCS